MIWLGVAWGGLRWRVLSVTAAPQSARPARFPFRVACPSCTRAPLKTVVSPGHAPLSHRTTLTNTGMDGLVVRMDPGTERRAVSKLGPFYEPIFVRRRPHRTLCLPVFLSCFSAGLEPSNPVVTAFTTHGYSLGPSTHRRAEQSSLTCSATVQCSYAHIHVPCHGTRTCTCTPAHTHAPSPR